jgi:putative spermidine/putrescine transport system ATP-binding protein
MTMETATAAATLKVSKLAKRYGSFVALAPTDLDVGRGEVLTLLGPSGSGKTTLLSLIAGLIHPDEGQVIISGADVTFSPPYARDIGMVFQNYALFPHMTVEENIAFPLEMRQIRRSDARRMVAEALEIVRLPHVTRRYPRELSGGQQQRVALARCMVYRPSIVLMDEPLGALDKKLREQMQIEIKRIHRELSTTIVYVTHDQEEAMTLSDRICLMSAGRVEQLGSPADLYFRPCSLFAADFLGESNLLPAQVSDVAGGSLHVVIAGTEAAVPATGNGGTYRKAQKVKLMVRPQNLRIVAGPAAQAGKVPARLTDIMVSGSLTKLRLEPLVPGLPSLVAAYPTSERAAHNAIGEHLSLDWNEADAVVIADEERG